MNFARKLFDIPQLFVLIGILLGVPYAFLSGVLHVADEEAHFLRAYQTSRGNCRGTPAIGVAVNIRQRDQFPWVELPPNSAPADVLHLIDNPKGGTYDVVALFAPVSLYSCVPYLASGAGLGLGRLFATRPLTLMYLGRLANLGAYLSLVYLALRILPDFRLQLAAIALMPMTLQQAASLSIDSMTIALSFVLSAYALRLAMDDQIQSLRPRHYLTLAALAILVALCKATLGLILLVALIPSRKFRSPARRWVVVGGYFLGALAVTAVWQYVNWRNGDIFTALKTAAGIHVGSNLLSIAHHPFGYLAAVVGTLISDWAEFVQEFVGKLGWLDVVLPSWVVIAYFAVLILVAAASSAKIRVSDGQKRLLVGIFIVNLMATFAIVGATWNSFSAEPGIHTTISGVQGRYLIPFAFPLLISLSGFRIRIPQGALIGLMAAMIFIANGVALARIWDMFHVHTSTLSNRFALLFHGSWPGSSKNSTRVYQGRVVGQRDIPDPAALLFYVDQGAKHRLQDPNWMTRQGYRWPDDVVFLPALELDAIPSGAPVLRQRKVYRPPSGVELTRLEQQLSLPFGGLPGDVAVVGDWNGDGRSKKGIYRKGTWLLDWDGDGKYRIYQFGGLPDDVPITGDWTGDGKTKVGLFRSGYFWVLDTNGNGVIETTPGGDRSFPLGGLPGDVPVVGDWNGDGRSKAGIFRQGHLWILDVNGNGFFDGTGPGQDRVLSFGGIAGDIPVVGDWTGDGKTNVGIYRFDHYWILDARGNGNFDGAGPGQGISFRFGTLAGDTPVVGDWSGSGKTNVGVYRQSGFWLLDVKGEGREP